MRIVLDKREIQTAIADYLEDRQGLPIKADLLRINGEVELLRGLGDEVAKGELSKVSVEILWEEGDKI